MASTGNQAITKEEIRRIYALGAGAGLVMSSGSREDLLHDVVRRMTGKDSVSALTHDEFRAVQYELMEKLKMKNRQEPLSRKSKRHEELPGGVTADQQRKIWRLMFLLRDMDEITSRATLGERLCGIIRKQLHRDCTQEQPFRFLSMADGWRLIEILKRIVDHTSGKEADGGA